MSLTALVLGVTAIAIAVGILVAFCIWLERKMFGDDE